MCRKLAGVLLALLFVSNFILIAPRRTLAQIGGTGSIQGVVTDPTGAVIAGASVTATNLATGVNTPGQSNAAGLYLLTPLPPGKYKVAASAAGFQPLEHEQVIVDALTTVTLNLSMQVGGTSETIKIIAASPQLNTSDARLGTTIRNELYTNLPLAMGTAVAGSGIGQGPRNPGAFIFLLPGVSEGNRWGTINGAQGFSKDVFIEGVPITDPIQQGEGRTISLGVSVEAVEQFQVETSGTGVEFNGQGSENYTIKSGANQFHGSGFEYLRNTALDARGFFPVVRPVEHQNEFGVTIGGPIIKNRLFFFFSYDGWRYRVTSPTQFATVPTNKMRQGDFSELLALPTPVQIYDPLSTVSVPGGFRRTPFPGNIIPPQRISSISKVYQSLLPAPTNSSLQNNYLGAVPVAYNNDSFNAKVDYSLTANQRLSGLYTHGKRSQPGPYREISSTIPQSVLPLPYTDTRLVEEIPTVLQVKHAWTLNPTLINQVNFS
ncbi:MAG TPA: carboxypeptidase-like regulatory domain-containing protein, partial [Blastocatellia bacterium]|nr:carboxypeptidase-like regulatory domain-containing protein [Blastocatellia bacterium]